VPFSGFCGCAGFFLRLLSPGCELATHISPRRGGLFFVILFKTSKICIPRQQAGLILSRCFAPGYHIVAPLGLLIIASTRVFYVKVKSKHRKSNIVNLQSLPRSAAYRGAIIF
jgi:hypothetical protein